jgi:hypothetical protein
MDAKVVVTAIVATWLVVVGVYGIWRTHDVKPRSRRPELATTLYLEFGAFVIAGMFLAIFVVTQ